MSTDTTIPVNVSEEAAEHISKLGQQEAFEQMVQYAREHFPGLHRIEVTRDDALWDSSEPGLTFHMYYPDPDPAGDLDPYHRAWNDWLVDAFPPDILRHFGMIPYYRAAHGR